MRGIGKSVLQGSLRNRRKIMQTTEKLALDVSEAAALLGVSRPTMYEIMNRADFTAAFRIGTRRKISRAGLIAWIERQTEGGADNAE